MKRWRRGSFIALITLSLGVWLDSTPRQVRPSTGISDCFCTSVQCGGLAIIDHPALAHGHPSGTWPMLRDARWRDGWYG